MILRGIARSFRCAFAGLWYVIRTQRNVRIQLCIGAGVTALGLWLGLSPVKWTLLALTIGFVLASEMINTAVEVLTDLTCPEYHPLAKAAKDASAGAVLLAALTSIAVGLFVLGPPLGERLWGG